MKLNAYLQFDGNCEAAWSFYAEIFNGKVELMRFRDAPPCEGRDAPPPDHVMHGCVTFADQSLMGTDATMGAAAESMKGAHAVINTDDVTQAEYLFAALEPGGDVQMPIGKTLWAERYGIVTDRFGTSWMVNCATAA
ncbi:MAG: VOC family protein [Dokdonella sp.]